MGLSLEATLAQEMARWESAGLRRRLRDEEHGRVDFASNDYLGLSRDPAVVEAARRALSDEGAGGRASRLLGGGGVNHRLAEEQAAEWLGAQASLLFPSGYQANLGLVGALVGRGDAIFSGSLNHASLIDAARLSRARVHVHRHLDLAELETQLERARAARRRLVLTEGVFSMDGDSPPLVEMAELCERHDAWLVVDEAHAAGLIGPQGAGAWAAAGLESDALAARIVTGGKALGVGGAFVVGSAALREHLVNRARSFVFTTAPPPAVAAALHAAIERARSMQAERAHTLQLARELASGLGLPAPAAAVVPFVVESSERALELASELNSAGLDVRAVRPPTVPENGSRLRAVLHAFNTAAEVDELSRRLSQVPDSAAPRRKSQSDLARALFVVGTDTEIGKTVVSAMLVHAAARLGAAAYWKPVQTGEDSDTQTVGELTRLEPHALLRPAWSLKLPASPHEAAKHEGKLIEPSTLEESFDGLRRMLPDTRLIVELAGGLLVPYRDDPELVTQAHWLEKARVPLVLVARSGLGTLNHTLLTLEALRARHLEPRALFLVGDAHESNRETLARATRIEHVFEVPIFPEPGVEAFDEWLESTGDLSTLFEA